MSYLFFDIECANCFNGTGKICEFGYLVTNEKFEVVESNEYVINPDAPFDWYALKNILKFTKEDYAASPLFPEFYDKIRGTMLAPDQIIFGHSVGNDARFLRSACERYKLPLIDFVYVDIGMIYKKLNNLTDICSLDKMCKALEVDNLGELHVARTDATMTMLVLQKICLQTGLSPKELIETYPEACGRLDPNAEPKKKKQQRPKRDKAQRSEIPSEENA